LSNRDRLKRELLNRQRFAVLGSQLATTVHVMRNPLTVIRAMGQLGIGLAAKNQAKEMFIKIIDQVDSLTGMLDDLLDTSRAEEPSEGSPAEIVREVFEAAGPSCAAAGIETDLVTSGESRTTLQVRAFKRAIHNLVTNAIKAMPNGGSLVARVFTNGEMLTIEIGDTGKGIAPEVQPILFEPFVSGGGGKGLGLYMVHKTITEDHHGRIRFESRAGKGTKFIIELPIVSASRAALSLSETDVAATGE
jgi:signal transduction histidine kinase